MILFLTSDLLMQSSQSAAASRRGLRLVTLSNVADAVEQINHHPVAALFVDLQMRGLDTTDLIRQLQTLPDPPKTIAFAQHVEQDLLDAVRGSVIDHVMTRGQFNHRLPQLIGELESAAEPGSSEDHDSSAAV